LKYLIRNVQKFRKKINLKIKDKIELYLQDEKLFRKSQKVIEGATGSKIVFGDILGKKSDFEFENKKYEFGIKI